MTVGTNWAGNHTYRATRLHRPTTLEQVQEIVAAAPRIRVLGSRHSFTDIADSAELLSLEAVHAAGSRLAGIDVDLAAGTVTLGGGVRYGELADVLRDAGAALHNTASLPHISVAGGGGPAPPRPGGSQRTTPPPRPAHAWVPSA
ncbi:FAD-binding protein, partial [Geodermatophilus sp. SYSU D00079]